jgi:anthranilate phosphoribosyltransferase
MKHAIGPRREIGVRTVFNILGPLTNPAGATRQILGVFDAGLTELVAGVLKNLGSEHACVVHGQDGMDEVSTCATTTVAELSGGNIRRYEVTPEELGLARAKLADLQVEGAVESAKVIREVLSGKPGPARDIVLANAGFGLLAGDVVKNAAQGVKIAGEVIDSGKAARALEKLIEVSNRPA